ncbi:MAG TPA: hypothetical protein VIK81_00850 [Patescibacteria group bacterium]
MIREFERPYIPAKEIREESEILSESVRSFLDHLKKGESQETVNEALNFYAHELKVQAEETQWSSAKLMEEVQDLANQVQNIINASPENTA